MPKKCCVSCCTSTRKNSILYKFPLNENKLSKWLEFLNDQSLKTSNIHKLFVCHKHFEKRFINFETSRLRIIAYPTLFTPREISSGVPDVDLIVPKSDHNYSRQRHYDHTYCKNLPSTSGNTTMMFDGNYTFNTFSTFDHRSQEWNIFHSRFIQFCTENNINDDTDEFGLQRRALLLTALGEETYCLVKDLVYLVQLDEVSCESLIELLTKHFLSKKSSFAERYKFYKAEQSPGEDLTEWATRVCSLAQNCGFKAELETVLRDRFVLGLENPKEKEKLFAESIETLTFSTALELAQSVRRERIKLESARIGTYC